MITFPTSPSIGQLWVAQNGASYTWTGDRWSSVVAIQQGIAIAYDDAGDSLTTEFDDEIDGGDSTSVHITTVDSGKS